MNRYADIWYEPIERFGNGKGVPVMDYDIRVSMAKNGKTNAVRFSFLRDAKKIFEDYKYVAVSDIEKVENRIYFRPLNSEAKNIRANKILTPKKGSTQRFALFTMPKSLLEKYKQKWIGTYDIKFDDESGWYYIEAEERTC